MAPGPLGVGIADGDVRCLLGTLHAHVWTRSLAGCRGRVVAGTPDGACLYATGARLAGKQKKCVCVCARVFTIGQSSGVYNSMRRMGLLDFMHV